MMEFRLGDYLDPAGLVCWRRFLWKSQFFPADRIRDWQGRRLRRLLAHCVRRVPFYARLFAERRLRPEDFRGPDDLALLPLLDKDALLERRDEFIASDARRYHSRALQTSGTTGTPLDVLWDRPSNVMELACVWRHFSWAGYRLGRPFLDIRHHTLEDAPGGVRWERTCRALRATSTGLGASRAAELAGLLASLRIRFWRGQPGALADLLRALEAAGLAYPKPRGIVSVGAQILPGDRVYLESVAGVPVCDNYGLMEHNVFIGQCPRGGYHIASEYGIVEILKEDGRPARPGETGVIVATGLHNRAFPLLRYVTRDYAVASDRVCACGRTLPLVERLEGRIDDRVRLRTGERIGGMTWVLYGVKGIRACQMVQDAEDRLDVFVVPTSAFDAEAEALLLRHLAIKTQGQLDVRLRRVERVPHEAGRKFKVVVNLLPRS